MKIFLIFVVLILINFNSLIPQNLNNRQNRSFYNTSGKQIFHKDRIYFKIKPDVKINPEKKPNVQNTFLRLGLTAIDSLLNKFGADDILPAFRLSPELPKKTKDRLQKSNTRIKDISKIYSIKISEDKNPIDLINELNNDVNIEYAELVPIDEPCAVPNDTMYSQQQHLPQIMAEQAWEVFKGEQSDSVIIIGISDTGTNWNHPDLTANLFQNLSEDADGDGHVIEYDDSLKKFVLDPGDLDSIDNDKNGYVDDLIGWDFLMDYKSDTQGNDPLDYNNHGTHVAGIAAGVTNNNIGIASISWNVKYMPTSHSSPGFNYILRGYEGIVYLAEMGCDVINCSWGGDGYSIANQEALEYAASLGALVVVAAGNNGNSKPFYPSSYHNVVSIASVAVNDVKSGYSNFNKAIELSIPGGESWKDGGILSCTKDGGYAKYQGTSMASPFAAGVFGLVKSAHPDLTNEELLTQVLGTADNIDSLNPNYKNMLGNGRANAFRALTEIGVTVPKTLKLEIMNVEVDDSTDLSNKNLALEPGEIARIGFSIRNYSLLTGSDKTKLTLTTNDANIEILQGEFETKFSPDGTTDIDKIFEIKLSDNIPSGFVKFKLNAESEDAEIILGSNLEFEIPINAGGIFIWDAVVSKGFSGVFIRDFLQTQGVQSVYSNNFPVTLAGFDAVLLSFGGTGDGMNEYPMESWLTKKIRDYLGTGGKLYLESMGGLGYISEEDKELLPLLGIDSIQYGTIDVHNLDSLFGIEGTITEGLIYKGISANGLKFIDKYYPSATGKVAFNEPLYGNMAIQNEGSFGQKTFVSVYPVSLLVDRNHPYTRYELVKRIMGFLGLPFEYTVPRFSYNPRTGHAPLNVNFNDVSYTSVNLTGYEWDFDGTGIVDTLKIKNPSWTFDKPGDYVTQLTNDNGLMKHSVSNPVYVFDGESAGYFKNNTKGSLNDTNMNIPGAFTIEAWVYPEEGGPIYGSIAHRMEFGLLHAEDENYNFSINHADGSYTDIYTSAGSMTFGVWQFVSLSYDGDSIVHFYLNGKEWDKYDYAEFGKGTIKENKNFAFTVGNSLNGGNAFNGRIDELRLWQNVRSGEEIRNSFTKKLSGTEKDLLLYWQFNEGNGTKTIDKSPNGRECTLNSDWRQGVHEGHIVGQPQPQTLCEKSTLMIQPIIVESDAQLTYQWYLNDVKIPGATEIIYTKQNIQKSDEGSYRLELTGINPPITESTTSASISVVNFPVITKQPEDVIINLGDTFELSIEATGEGILKYEWFHDGISLNFFEPIFTAKAETMSLAGTYYCIVKNDCEVYSDTANVMITVDVDDNLGTDLWIELIPNPAYETVRAILNNPNSENFEIIINDYLGRELKNIKNTHEQYGIFSIEISLQGIQSGLYYVTLKTKNKIISNRLIILK